LLGLTNAASPVALGNVPVGITAKIQWNHLSSVPSNNVVWTMGAPGVAFDAVAPSGLGMASPIAVFPTMSIPGTVTSGQYYNFALAVIKNLPGYHTGTLFLDVMVQVCIMSATGHPGKKITWEFVVLQN
jgi:hypothetical protein